MTKTPPRNFGHLRGIISSRFCAGAVEVFENVWWRHNAVFLRAIPSPVCEWQPFFWCIYSYVYYQKWLAMSRGFLAGACFHVTMLEASEIRLRRRKGLTDVAQPVEKLDASQNGLTFESAIDLFRSSFRNAPERGQAHFAPKTPQNEPVPGGFELLLILMGLGRLRANQNFPHLLIDVVIDGLYGAVAQCHIHTARVRTAKAFVPTLSFIGILHRNSTDRACYRNRSLDTSNQLSSRPP
jgi:hypothetical protein